MSVLNVLLCLLVAVIIMWLIIIPLIFIQLYIRGGNVGNVKSDKYDDPISPEQQLKSKKLRGED